ncbi:MAG: hypothetical protein QXG66_05195 [Candidatus Bathyarchaeia archaeon]|nr:hypothetical protein [Candidatus Brockarchaeota archaeon]
MPLLLEQHRSFELEHYDMVYHAQPKPVSTYSMACDIGLWPKIMNAGERFRKLSLEEQERVVNYFREKGIKPLFPD